MTIGLSTLAYRHIKDKLLSGSLPGGSMLSETVLAKEIGISRTPVREAISQLEREGVLDQIPRYGTFVRVLDRDEVSELYDFRTELESFAVTRASQRMTLKAHEELLDLCRQMMNILRNIRLEAQQDSNAIPTPLVEKWMLADASFHTAVIRLANNRWLTKVAGNMRLMEQVFGHWQQIPGKNRLTTWVRTYREHRRLVRALANGNATLAREIIVKHIRLGKEKVLAHYDWAEQQRKQSNPELLSDSLRKHLHALERYALISDRQVRTRATRTAASRRRRR